MYRCHHHELADDDFKIAAVEMSVAETSLLSVLLSF